MMWPTPEGMGGGKTSRGNDRKDELLLAGMVKVWPTNQNSTPDDTVNRTHRLKALGNGIVPACAYPFARAIAEALESE